MQCKEFFKPTKWKIIISCMPLILLIISISLAYLIGKLFAGSEFFEIIPFGLYMFSLIFFWPPLNSIFCEYEFLADNCYGFLAFPEITLIGYIFLGLINGIVVYLFYSLIAHIIKKK